MSTMTSPEILSFARENNAAYARRQIRQGFQKFRQNVLMLKGAMEMQKRYLKRRLPRVLALTGLLEAGLEKLGGHGFFEKPEYYQAGFGLIIGLHCLSLYKHYGMEKKIKQLQGDMQAMGQKANDPELLALLEQDKVQTTRQALSKLVGTDKDAETFIKWMQQKKINGVIAESMGQAISESHQQFLEGAAKLLEMQDPAKVSLKP